MPPLTIEPEGRRLPVARGAPSETAVAAGMVVVDALSKPPRCTTGEEACVAPLLGGLPGDEALPDV